MSLNNVVTCTGSRKPDWEYFQFCPAAAQADQMCPLNWVLGLVEFKGQNHVVHSIVRGFADVISSDPGGPVATCSWGDAMETTRPVPLPASSVPKGTGVPPDAIRPYLSFLDAFLSPVSVSVMCSSPPPRWLTSSLRNHKRSLGMGGKVLSQ